MPTIPSEIIREVIERTGNITGFSAASGGCINSGGRVSTASGAYFLKWNDRNRFPDMFLAEAEGLMLLRKAKAFAIPEVIYAGFAAQYQFLLLEFIASAERSTNFWVRFGTDLALIHQQSAQAFGLDHDNYIGSLSQRNKPSSSWTEFFVNKRLSVQLRLARDAGRIDQGLTKKFEALFKHLPSLLPEERPSLVHGDLWSGNLMTNAKGAPALIDPAVYYGNREVDLAMTQLFGGFDWSYLESYNEVFPLIPGYEDRFDIYNLYPLLVHVNLFGGGYKAQVSAILDRFVQ